MISEYGRKASTGMIDDAISTLRRAIWVIGHDSREAYADLCKVCHEYHPVQILNNDLDAINYTLKYGMHDILELRKAYTAEETQEDA